MSTLKKLSRKDIAPWLLALLIVCVFAAKAVLGWQQEIYVWVNGAPLDDELMYKAAQSITAGNWLGDYNYLTLSKQMFFAVWLAGCHALHVPYLMAGQLFVCVAALACTEAFFPVIRRNWMRFILFAALAFNPASSASFTLRVYRDNIFPAECMLFFAGLIGAALRREKGLKSYLPRLLLSGLGLGLAFITREDGIWLMPFAVLGGIIIAIAVLLQKDLKQKLLRVLGLALPFAGMAVCVCAMSYMNYIHYGIFTTSDFSSGSFAAAYGAMTRVQQEEHIDLVPVPKEVRLKLYEAVPELQCLEPWLEENAAIQNAYMNKTIKDYQGGSFYWVLRRAAQEEGIYSDAQTAQAYWQKVADAINAAIDNGTLQAETGVRNTTTPIIRAEHVLPTLQETLHSFFFCITFQDCSCFNALASGLSLALPEDAEAYRQYTGNAVNYAAVEGSDIPYYSARQLLLYNAVDTLRYVYVVLVPVLFALALVLQIRRAVLMLKQKNAGGLVLWLVLLGVLGMALLRAAMISFMEVASFNIGTSVMYLSTVHPLLILFAVAGVFTELPQQAEEH